MATVPTFSKEILDTPEWYLLKVPARYREKIRKLYEQYTEDLEVNCLCIVPKHRVLRLGAKKPSTTTLYPDYLLLIGEYTDEIDKLFERVFDRFKLEIRPPVRMKPNEIRELRGFLEPDSERNTLAQLEIDFEVGDLVEIRSGSLAGFKGRVDSLNGNKQTAKIQFSIFGRQTDAEIAISELCSLS